MDVCAYTRFNLRNTPWGSYKITPNVKTTTNTEIPMEKVLILSHIWNWLKYLNRGYLRGISIASLDLDGKITQFCKNGLFNFSSLSCETTTFYFIFLLTAQHVHLLTNIEWMPAAKLAGLLLVCLQGECSRSWSVRSIITMNLY